MCLFLSVPVPGGLTIIALLHCLKSGSVIIPTLFVYLSYIYLHIIFYNNTMFDNNNKNHVL